MTSNFFDFLGKFIKELTLFRRLSLCSLVDLSRLDWFLPDDALALLKNVFLTGIEKLCVACSLPSLFPGSTSTSSPVIDLYRNLDLL
jgi:hypothetical protein